MPPIPLSPAALQVCTRRYFQKSPSGEVVEDWNGLVTRVTNSVCVAESSEFRDRMFDLIYSTKFLPNSPCLKNAGTSVGGLLACFVTPPPDDSWDGMVQNISRFGNIARRGGGCGVDFSTIRPRGAPIMGSTHGKACGPVAHMQVVSEAMASITQGGFRGMACMGVLDVTHPDILEFITSKTHTSALRVLLREDITQLFDKLATSTSPDLSCVLDKFISNFNISVRVTNHFMEQVEQDGEVALTFAGATSSSVRARSIFDAIVQNAYNNGDPGLLFETPINQSPYRI